MRKTTLEKIQEEQERKQQSENRIKSLLKEQKEEERKARTKRLIERGAIVESLIVNPADLSNEQFQEMIATALGKQPTLKKSEVATEPAEQTDESEDEGMAF